MYIRCNVKEWMCQYSDNMYLGLCPSVHILSNGFQSAL
jgi:hypothetical protein